MAVEQFTLIRGEDEKTLAEWGAIRESIVLDTGAAGATSQSEDTLSFSVRRAVGAAALFARGDEVELWCAGVRRFVGYALSARPSATGKKQWQAITFQGPARWLQGTYLQPEVVVQTDGGFSYAGELQSWVVLNRELILTEEHPFVNSVTIKAQVEEILAQAKATGNLGGAAPFDYDTCGLPEQVCEAQIASNITFLAAIEKELARVPGATMWWDYAAAGLPVLRFTVMTVTDSAGDLLDPPTLDGSGSPEIHTLPNDGTVLEEFQPETQGQLVGKLVLNWKYVDDATNLKVIRREIALANNGSNIVRHVTLSLLRKTYNGSGWVDPEQPPGAGIAKLLIAAAAREWWKFNAAVRDISSADGVRTQSFHWEWKPGDLANIADAGAELAAAFAVMQRFRRFLGTGRTVLDTGTPAMRGITQARALSGGGAPEDKPEAKVGSKQWGFEPPDEGSTPGTNGTNGTDGLNATFDDITVDGGVGTPSVDVVGPDPGNAWTLAFHNLKGEPGAGATVDVSSTTTGEPGTDALVENAGTPENAILRFTIPRGADGISPEEVAGMIADAISESCGGGGCEGYVTAEALAAAIADALAAQKADILGANPELVPW
jgi:hypothetical protein